MSRTRETVNDEAEEPDPKRLRLTNSYEIALSVCALLRTYAEAMASPDSAKLK